MRELSVSGRPAAFPEILPSRTSLHCTAIVWPMVREGREEDCIEYLWLEEIFNGFAMFYETCGSCFISGVYFLASKHVLVVCVWGGVASNKYP